MSKMLKIYKVYAVKNLDLTYAQVADPEHNLDFELCLANNAIEASNIVKDVWYEAELTFPAGQVVEMQLPEKTGLIYEPESHGVRFRF